MALSGLTSAIGHTGTLRYDESWDGVVTNFSADATSTTIIGDRPGMPVRDATLSTNIGEVDITSFISYGYKEWIGGLVDATASFELVWWEASYQNALPSTAPPELYDAALQRLSIGWAWTLADPTANAAAGDDALALYFKGLITECTLASPNEDANIISLTVRLTPVDIGTMSSVDMRLIQTNAADDITVP